jgi:hypothetical protein
MTKDREEAAQNDGDELSMHSISFDLELTLSVFFTIATALQGRSRRLGSVINHPTPFFPPPHISAWLGLLIFKNSDWVHDKYEDNRDCEF